MENQEKKSKWDELARELGAEVSPESERSEAPAADEPPLATAPPRPQRAKPSAERPSDRPKPSPKSWDHLAADLGIAPLAGPRPTRDSAPQQESAASAAGAPRAARAPKPVEAREPDEASPRAEPPATAPVAQAAPPSGGVSLWHKIFGSPEQQAEKIAEVSREAPTAHLADSDRPHEERSPDERPPVEKSRDSRRRRHGSRSAERPTEEPESDLEDAASWTEVPAKSEFGEPDEDGESLPAGDEETKKRRGRRRRRGRGRKSDAEGGVDELAHERGDEGAPPARERGGERGGERGSERGRGRRRPAAAHDEPVDDEDLVDELDRLPAMDDDVEELDLDAEAVVSQESSGRERPAGHRSIPSWDDAIGIIVETNLATRSERRRSAPQASRGSSSSRGRSRGRRKKKS